MDTLFIVGLALCFGITYWLCVSKATENFRATKAGEGCNNPILTGAGVGLLLCVVLIGYVSITVYIVNAGIGALVGWAVLLIKNSKKPTPPTP